MGLMEHVSVQVRVRTIAGEEPEFAVRHLELVERIDRPFEASLDLVTEELEFEVRGLLGARVLFDVDRPGDSARSICGVVSQAEYVTTRNRQLTLRVRVESSLAMLRYRVRRRIFSDLSLFDVLSMVADPVFKAHGGAWGFSRATGEYPPRDYVVQYDESDLDFVLRLLSECGLSLVYGEGEEEAVYVLVDSNAMLPSVGGDPLGAGEPAPRVVFFEPEGEVVSGETSVQYLGRVDSVHARGATVQARDWKTAGGGRFGTELERPAEGREGHVWSYHPRRLDEGPSSESGHENETEAWATRALEEQEAAGVEVSGASNVADLSAGVTFELQGHPHGDLDQRYAVLSVIHHADFHEVELETGAVVHSTYTNRFVAQPLDTGVVRPPLLEAPCCRGIEAATVVGPEGDEIYTDALGRVRVRFHWDDAPSQTCWLRVLSPWAGAGYGASFVPRVGMEVVVGFLGGNPNRPVVTGCLYTGTNTPPGALPETKTCTTLRTQSSPGGEGFNELRFEDAKGSEELFMHAQRNHRTVVRAAQSTSVGASRSLSVGKDSTRSIAGSETVHIGKQNADAKGGLQVVVAGGEHRDIGDVHSLHATSALWTADEAIVGNAEQMVRWSCATAKADASGRAPMSLTRPPTEGAVVTMMPTTVCVEAPESIKLKVGDTTLELTPKGIALHGPVITADAEKRMWLTAPAGRVSLSEQGASVFGGPKSESVVRLKAQALSIKAKGALEQTAKSVEVRSSSSLVVGGQTLQLSGAKTATLKSASVGVTGANVDIHSEGLVDVRGTPIKLNS
jgi:type VI secretion system secreted protein VgrG